MSSTAAVPESSNIYRKLAEALQTQLKKRLLVMRRNKWTPLHIASREGCLRTVITLVNNGADIDVEVGDGYTPLLLAAKWGHKDIVELLINAGADLKFPSQSNETLLHHASEYGWLDIVRYLLKKVADIHTKTDPCRFTPLYLATRKGHKEIVELLINTGANVNCSDFVIQTPLHFALENGWLDIVQSLLEAGADPNAGSIVPSLLCELIFKLRDTKLVKLCIESGAYFTPLDFRTTRFDLFKCRCKVHDFFQDEELCSRVIINEFNFKDLSELYKLSMYYKNLPCVEKMRIRSNSQVANEVLQSVGHDIQVRGYCDVITARPIVLQMLSVKSLLSYWDNIKKQDEASNMNIG